MKYHFNIPFQQLIDATMIHKFVHLINSTGLAVSVIWAGLSESSPRTKGYVCFYGRYLRRRDTIFVPLIRCPCLWNCPEIYTCLLLLSAAACFVSTSCLSREPVWKQCGCFNDSGAKNGSRASPRWLFRYQDKVLYQCNPLVSNKASWHVWDTDLFSGRGNGADQLQVGCPLDPTWAFLIPLFRPDS